MLEFDFTFPHSYDVEQIREWPGTGSFSAPVIWFPPPKARAEHDGLWLRVRAKSGKTWIGVFAFGYTSPPAFSRVISSPNPESVCVVSDGRAYIVNAEKPDVWEQIPILPFWKFARCLNTNFWSFPISPDWVRMGAMDWLGEAPEFAGMN